MELNRREAEAQPPFNVDSPASEAASSRRRAGGQKRKVNANNASNSSSAPSKRITREKTLPAHPLPIHNGPLTRARQIPSNPAVVASTSAAGGVPASSAAAVKQSEHAVPTQALAGDLVALAEDFNKESQWQALEAAIEADFEAIRSRGTNAHVVPSHCGWFSWTEVHPIEMHTMSSFFNGKTENRTPDIYLVIRNWILKKFHSNPNAKIELKDLSELNIGDLDGKQEVMDFLDHWGLINFHLFPSMDSSVAGADDDGAAEKNSLVEKLYHFETLQLCRPILPKTNVMIPAIASGLFPESTIAEELVKQEGPEVEYHCNFCSADCSRKRYHCQKQADFDLCTDCFSNGKFGSGMSSSDFILMEPAEVPGFSSGKWTDQETLLLLEALELYKENWNEIAEHVATKSKSQCILHFVQMPIQDAFIDCDNVHVSCKETADPSATNNDSSILKDASEFVESKTSDSPEGQVLPPHNEFSKAEDSGKVKDDNEKLKAEDGCDKKTSEETTKPEDPAQVKVCQELGDDFALKALKEAFEAVGYSFVPEGLSSFAEVGNPAMALAVFFARLVGSDMAVASAHSSLKSISGMSSSIELAARHCYFLEDPPDDKESTTSERDPKKDGEQEDGNEKQDKLKLDDKDLSSDHNDRNVKNNASEIKKQLASTGDGAPEKTVVLNEQAMVNQEEVQLDNHYKPSNSKCSNDQAPSTVQGSDASNSEAEIPPSSEEFGGKTVVKEPCQSAAEPKDEHMLSDSLPSDKNELQQSITSNPDEECSQPVEKPKDMEMVSDSVALDEGKSLKPPSANLVGESLETTDSVMDVDMVSSSSLSEKNETQPLVTSDSSQHIGTEKDVDIAFASVPLDENKSSHPVTSNSAAENGTMAGEDHRENSAKQKYDTMKTKSENKFVKVKRAAVSTLAAAAVKAKLIANQEEDLIQQLATLLIEKQLHKLETKLAFFNDIENVIMRVREHLDRLRQKLYHERALIIASRLGLPASSSRGVTPSLPNNRIPMNFANSVSRPAISMNSMRPPIFRPIGTGTTIHLNYLASAAAMTNSVRPSGRENFSSNGTK